VSPPPYELYYWPGIQGRGEFVRLAFEAAGAPYVDVARTPRGMRAVLRILRDGPPAGVRPFAPPFLKHGSLVIAQTANVLAYLGPRLGLVPRSEASRIAALQIQLTIADLVTEAHDVHHPISSGLYYEQQKGPAKVRAAAFTDARMPKFLGWLERELVHSSGPYLLGRQLSYVDLSAFQVVAGLRYAFPNAMERIQGDLGRLLALADRVAERPRLAAYLGSSRRVAFNKEGIFRHYRELDAVQKKAAGRARSSP
jgi:glutathione S-transferase